MNNEINKLWKKMVEEKLFVYNNGRVTYTKKGGNKPLIDGVYASVRKAELKKLGFKDL